MATHKAARGLGALGTGVLVQAAASSEQARRGRLPRRERLARGRGHWHPDAPRGRVCGLGRANSNGIGPEERALGRAPRGRPRAAGLQPADAALPGLACARLPAPAVRAPRSFPLRVVSAAWTDFLPVLGQPRTPGSARQVLARGPLRCRASLLASGQGLSHVSLTETLRLSFLLRHRRKRPASRREWGALCFLEETVGWSSFSLK